MRQPNNDDITKAYNKAAPGYDRQMGFFERHMARGAREWALSQARGDVLEVGVGSGLNLPLYGPAVTSVLGIDLSEGMLAIARQRAERGGLTMAQLRTGDAQALDLPSDSADTVLSTFTFCTIPDPLAASREAYRILRSGGTFVLAEHGPSARAFGRAAMRAVEPLFIRFGTDHLMRDPATYLTGAGFTVTSVERGGRGGAIFRVLARKDA